MWFSKLKDLFVPSNDEIELMISDLRTLFDKESNIDCCEPRQQDHKPDTVGE